MGGKLFRSHLELAPKIPSARSLVWVYYYTPRSSDLLLGGFVM
jgi:hypothetical protein